VDGICHFVCPHISYLKLLKEGRFFWGEGGAGGVKREGVDSSYICWTNLFLSLTRQSFLMLSKQDKRNSVKFDLGQICMYAYIQSCLIWPKSQPHIVRLQTQHYFQIINNFFLLL
jgi:hypothetical protein